jgi:hypothetical protein
VRRGCALARPQMTVLVLGGWATSLNSVEEFTVIISVRSAPAFYVIVDLSYKSHNKKFKRVGDVRLYEVSLCNNDRIGLLVGGRNESEARSHALQLIALVGC